VRPPHPFQRIDQIFRDNGGKRGDQFIDPEFPDIDDRIVVPAGSFVEFGKFELCEPDRIFVTHAYRHQPGDLGQHHVIDALLADEPPQPVDVKLRVAGALILDQQMDGVARDIGHGLRQALGKKRRGVVLFADEVLEQVTHRRQNTAV
jgi:hypothetical protein